MPALIALALVLDQRIEWQLLAMLVLALHAHLRWRETWDGKHAAWVLAKLSILSGKAFRPALRAVPVFMCSDTKRW